MLKQPHSGSNNNRGPFFVYFCRFTVSRTAESLQHELKFSQQVVSAAHVGSSVDPEGRGEDSDIGGWGGVLCEHNQAHCFGLPASFYFRASFSSTHTCSLSGSSLSSAFYAIMLLGNCRRMMRSVGCVSGASRVM